MADIYLCGHGEWATKGAASGFAYVPKNTKISFYTPVGRFLGLGQAGNIIQGAGLRAHQTFSAYRSCTDLTLHPATEYQGNFQAFARGNGARVEFVGAPTRLSILLDRYAGHHLHWCACRARFGGLDTTEGGFNDDYML